MNSFANSKCVPCRSSDPPLDDWQIALFALHVGAWEVVERDGIKRLERVFTFEDFAQALAFTQKVGELAEAEGHHPALLTEWGKVTVTWWTHKIKGLHQNDFIMAAKTDRIYSAD